MAKVIATALFARAEQVASDHLKASAVEKIENKMKEILHK
jgi:hypothetical protein